MTPHHLSNLTGWECAILGEDDALVYVTAHNSTKVHVTYRQPAHLAGQNNIYDESVVIPRRKPPRIRATQSIEEMDDEELKATLTEIREARAEAKKVASKKRTKSKKSSRGGLMGEIEKLPPEILSKISQAKSVEDAEKLLKEYLAEQQS